MAIKDWDNEEHPESGMFVAVDRALKADTLRRMRTEWSVEPIRGRFNVEPPVAHGLTDDSVAKATAKSDPSDEETVTALRALWRQFLANHPAENVEEARADFISRVTDTRPPDQIEVAEQDHQPRGAPVTGPHRRNVMPATRESTAPEEGVVRKSLKPVARKRLEQDLRKAIQDVRDADLDDEPVRKDRDPDLAIYATGPED